MGWVCLLIEGDMVICVDVFCKYVLNYGWWMYLYVVCSVNWRVRLLEEGIFCGY